MAAKLADNQSLLQCALDQLIDRIREISFAKTLCPKLLSVRRLLHALIGKNRCSNEQHD